MRLQFLKSYLYVPLISAHLIAILIRGYFLFPEFTLYPYLVSRGLLPYRQLIDQHLPGLFFGPISLPYYLTSNPFPLLLVFLFTLLLTDLLFFRLLKYHKVRYPLLYLSLFLVSHFFFSGNKLWIETFILPLLLILLLTVNSSSPLLNLVSGFTYGLALVLRPTLLIALFLLQIVFAKKLNRYHFSGFVIYPLLVLIYLGWHNLFPHFWTWGFQFNTSTYSRLALQYPNQLQLTAVVIFIAVPLIVLLKNSQWIKTLTLLSLLLPVYPRFDEERLQPFVLITLLFFSQSKPGKLPPLFMLVIITLLSAKSLFSPPVGNFFLTEHTRQAALYVSSLPSPEVFVLGGSDLIYPLARKRPTGSLYIPSLPWYLTDSSLTILQLDVLRQNPHSPIVINSTAALANHPITDYTPRVVDYIHSHYTLDQIIGPYYIYTTTPL